MGREHIDDAKKYTFTGFYEMHGRGAGKTFKADQVKEKINRVLWHEFAGKWRTPPEVIVKKDSKLGKYFIIVGNETQIVDRSKWEAMVSALGISSYEEFKHRFREACEWFIIEAQYVPFEEVKN